jgi:hypothetical protein
MRALHNCSICSGIEGTRVHGVSEMPSHNNSTKGPRQSGEKTIDSLWSEDGAICIFSMSGSCRGMRVRRRNEAPLKDWFVIFLSRLVQEGACATMRNTKQIVNEP